MAIYRLTQRAGGDYTLVARLTMDKRLIFQDVAVGSGREALVKSAVQLATDVGKNRHWQNTGQVTASEPKGGG